MRTCQLKGSSAEMILPKFPKYTGQGGSEWGDV